MAVSVDGNTVRMGVDPDKLHAEVMRSYVQSINGVYAASDGSFFLQGSECDSWGYIADGKALGTGSEEPETVAESGAVGIWLTDLCPACQTCDVIFAIKQDIEYMNVLLNMIKDVELHNSPILEANKAGLESMTISGQNCPPAWTRFDPAKGMQLLQQYITVAHMWNYAVVQNNASFKLEIAPEDTAGFVIQTKRSLPNCDSKWHIKCTISIAYDHEESDEGEVLSDKQDLSVYIPPISMRFKPFQLGENVNGTVITAEDAALDDARTHIECLSDCTTKIITTDTIVGRVAGTYELTVKILPFIYFVMRDKYNNVISIRGGTLNVTGTTTYDGKDVYYDFAPKRFETGKLIDPTSDQYLDSKTAPTASVPFKNVWRVQVLWEIGQIAYEETDEDVFYDEISRYPAVSPEPEESSVEFNKLAQYPPDADVPGTGTVQTTRGFSPESYFRYQETRMYTCTGVRLPNKDALVADSTIPVDIVEPPDETE